MTPLPQQFDGRADQKAFKFTQLKRHKDVVLLQKQFKDGSSPTLFYEVIIVRIIPQMTFADGRTIEPHEAMPKPEDWGTGGWSYPDLDSATKRFNLLADRKTDNLSPS